MRELTPGSSANGIYRRSCYRVRSGAVTQMTGALKTYLDSVGMNEPGTRRYLVVQAGAEPNAFVHLAEFADQQAFEASQSSAPYQTLVNTLRPVLEGEVSSETVAGSVVCGTGAGYIAPTDLVLLVRFKVKDRSKIRQFREIINEDLGNFRLRADPRGLLAFDAFADPEDERVYYYSQRWVSAEAQRLATQTYDNFAATERLCRSEIMTLQAGPRPLEREG